MAIAFFVLTHLRPSKLGSIRSNKKARWRGHLFWFCGLKV
jgi:hypothetical protein